MSEQARAASSYAGLRPVLPRRPHVGVADGRDVLRAQGGRDDRDGRGGLALVADRAPSGRPEARRRVNVYAFEVAYFVLVLFAALVMPRVIG